MPRPGSALITIATMATLVLLGAARSARAQLPQPRLGSLPRPGMPAGEMVEVTLHGTDLEGASQLWFDHPGLSATHIKDLTFRVTSTPDVPLGHHTLRVGGRYGISNPRTFVVGDRPESVETEPAKPIALTVRPAPLSLAIDNKGGAVKQGESLEIYVTIGRQNRFTSPVSVTLIAPASLKLAAEPVTVAESQNQTKLVIKTAKDSPPGAAALVFVRAAVATVGEDVDVEEPVGLTIYKP